MSDKVIRAAIARIEVFDGADILEEGHRTARYLWNQLWWELIGWTRKIQRARGERPKLADWPTKDYKWFVKNLKQALLAGATSSLAGKLDEYQGKFGIMKEMKDFWAYRDLSDRCASYTVADFDIAMRSWFKNLKTNSRSAPPRPKAKDESRPLRFEVGRNAKHLDSWTFRLTVLGGHIAERHAFVKLCLRPGIKLAQVHLIQIQPGDKQAVVMYEKTEKDPPLLGPGVCAIDLGIINLAVVMFDSGESILYTGKGLLENNQYYEKRAAKCKPSGYPKTGKGHPKQSARKKSYLNKETRRRHLLIHNFTRDVIRQCQARGVGNIIIGDLRGIRKDKKTGKGKNFGKKTNQKLHAWPFAMITSQLTYKGAEVGIIINRFSERGTSSHCPFCGAKTVRRPRGLLTCPKCEVVMNSDIAGSLNLLTKYLPDVSHGVEGIFPALPSPGNGESANRKATRIHPTFVAKFDLRNMAVHVSRCGALLQLKTVYSEAACRTVNGVANSESL